MLARVAGRLALVLARETGGGERERAILRYGGEVAILTVFELLLIAFAAWLWRCLPTTLAVCLGAAALRNVAGGAHCTSAGRCAVVSTLVLVTLGKIGGLWVPSPGAGVLVVLAAGLLAALAVLRWAPLDSPAKPLRCPTHKRHLRRLSLVMVLFVTGAGLAVAVNPGLKGGDLAVSLALGESWAALMLSETGRALIGLADRALRYRPWSS